jgi:hypothetical protein
MNTLSDPVSIDPSIVYFLVSFDPDFVSAAWGRRKVEVAAATFLSAFGFFCSRSLPLRPLATGFSCQVKASVPFTEHVFQRYW